MLTSRIESIWQTLLDHPDRWPVMADALDDLGHEDIAAALRAIGPDHTDGAELLEGLLKRVAPGQYLVYLLGRPTAGDPNP